MSFRRIGMKLDSLILVALLTVTIADVALSLFAMSRRRGLLRLLAGLPLMGLAGVSLNIIDAVRRDPASHNLWPFELFVTCVAGIAFSLLFLGVQALFLDKTKSSAES